MSSKNRIVVLACVLAAAGSSWAGQRAGEHKLIASPDGSELAVLTQIGQLTVVTAGGKKLLDASLESPVSEVEFSTDGAKLAACLWNGGLIVADIALGTVKKIKEGGCSDLNWSHDGKALRFVVQQNGQVEVHSFDLGSGTDETLHSAKAAVGFSGSPSGPPAGLPAPGSAPIVREPPPSDSAPWGGPKRRKGAQPGVPEPPSVEPAIAPAMTPTATPATGAQRSNNSK